MRRRSRQSIGWFRAARNGAFFDGVPLSILYDNLKIAVARICGDGKRERMRGFTELVSHYLLQDRFGRPAKAATTR